MGNKRLRFCVESGVASEGKAFTKQGKDCGGYKHHYSAQTPGHSYLLERLVYMLRSSPRIVENHRYHLRKKLELPEDANLSRFLAEM